MTIGRNGTRMVKRKVYTLLNILWHFFFFFAFRSFIQCDVLLLLIVATKHNEEMVYGYGHCDEAFNLLYYDFLYYLDVNMGAFNHVHCSMFFYSFYARKIYLNLYMTTPVSILYSISRPICIQVATPSWAPGTNSKYSTHTWSLRSPAPRHARSPGIPSHQPSDSPRRSHSP